MFLVNRLVAAFCYQKSFVGEFSGAGHGPGTENRRGHIQQNPEGAFVFLQTCCCQSGIEGVAVRDPWAEGHFVQDGDVWGIDFDSTEEVGPGKMVERKVVGELADRESQENS